MDILMEENQDVKSANEQESITIEHHQFIAGEVCPVRFGPKQDASSTTLIATFMVLATHFTIFVYCNYLSPKLYLTVWKKYLGSNQFLVGGLLYLWIVGFNIVSYVIYRQFERDEVYPADDYFVNNTINGINGSNGREPLVLRLPDDTLAIGLEVENHCNTTLQHNNTSNNCEVVTQ